MKPWLRHGLVLFIIALLSLSPLLLALLAGAFANANGCTLHEGNVHPCVVGGRDYGETLYTMVVLGWMSLVTMPLGMGAGGVYLLVVLFRRASNGTRK
ncbi:hypothetical protein [Meiothermus hypogaeus]|uniref:Uncharacterized protein n=2 Tax=Meiothermus hypogaeus TaxID=884155 RepID=A0A511R2D6_9DEIN|nr:hypothetical protein [Meiothermus hypogaeus]RIH80502.1 hypothetical protein Mhypo_00418 [Meiothermus hypogaeus]GEM83780.1 hypothetical protein MHY01S_19460 [Meiothermus hypogaeus NBRC 106114]